MKPRDIIRQIGRLGVEYFTPADIQKLTGSVDRNYIYLLLVRLEKEGAVKRLCQGVYVLEGRDYDLPRVAAQIYQPAYVSFDTVLFESGILSQGGYTITVATTRRARERTMDDGAIVQYITVPRALFWGFDTGTLRASPEKAFVDYCWLVKDGGVDPTLGTWYPDNLSAGSVGKIVAGFEGRGIAIQETVAKVLEGISVSAVQPARGYAP